jgi:hypothetical protein
VTGVNMAARYLRRQSWGPWVGVCVGLVLGVALIAVAVRLP